MRSSQPCSGIPRRNGSRLWNGDPRFRGLGFHQNKKLLLNWVGLPQFLPKQGQSEALSKAEARSWHFFCAV